MPYDITTASQEYRAPFKAMGHGLKGKCPNCGEGQMFHKYLKTAPKCTICDTDLSGHQADDAPSYFAMLFLSLIVAPLMVTVQLVYELPMWMSFAIWTPLSLAAVVAILQPIKGAIIALQWANRMHGFDDSSSAVPAEEDPNTFGPK